MIALLRGVKAIDLILVLASGLWKLFFVRRTSQWIERWKADTAYIGAADIWQSSGGVLDGNTSSIRVIRALGSACINLSDSS